MKQNGQSNGKNRKEAMPPRLSSQEAALLTADEKVARAVRALDDIGDAAEKMNGSALADEIDRRTGVGFEAAVLVVLSSGH